jgi:hypothetical protein
MAEETSRWATAGTTAAIISALAPATRRGSRTGQWTCWPATAARRPASSPTSSWTTVSYLLTPIVLADSSFPVPFAESHSSVDFNRSGSRNPNARRYFPVLFRACLLAMHSRNPAAERFLLGVFLLPKNLSEDAFLLATGEGEARACPPSTSSAPATIADRSSVPATCSMSSRTDQLYLPLLVTVGAGTEKGFATYMKPSR